MCKNDNVMIDHDMNIWCLIICIDKFDGKRKKCGRIHDMNKVNNVNIDFICNYIY